MRLPSALGCAWPSAPQPAKRGHHLDPLSPAPVKHSGDRFYEVMQAKQPDILEMNGTYKNPNYDSNMIESISIYLSI